MTYLPILCALALTSVQVYSQMQVLREEVSIQNQNVNIIVNLNPQEVAEELWKVIQARLNNRTDHPTSSRSTIQELEKAVIPLTTPTRRGTSQSIFQVASQLDKIARRALTRDTPNRSLLDEEIMARDIVADMMTALKVMISKTIQSKINEANVSSRRTNSIHSPVKIYDNEKDDYVNIRIKIRRQDIFDAIH
ncbi:hypothetical protein ACS0PU_002579 [Formica fusca]